MSQRPQLIKCLNVWLPVRSQTFFALLLLSGVGCQESAPTQPEEPRVLGSPVTGITTKLEDEVTSLPGGQIAWSTFWKLCWHPYPGARNYQLQVFTSEGASPRLRPQATPCYRLQIAAGYNAQTQGLLNRDKLISLQMGQLSYKIRAVLADNTVSEWSPVVGLYEASPSALSGQRSSDTSTSK
ncbi:hypothetical protein SAMN00120144_3952 [Hymenobacter roseosalivarius DSM 11622]|uniref:Lipoprotein n=1 Tax=Hymenobacter roseosalivarius DSM 11622 TaxID=645990 RepID=A0A1W1UQE2_9BACT|nr:hypothetical protein SAMN00120144_3952 [Hymenobacter roseosalivarius DSM 11622]